MVMVEVVPDARAAVVALGAHAPGDLHAGAVDPLDAARVDDLEWIDRAQGAHLQDDGAGARRHRRDFRYDFWHRANSWERILLGCRTSAASWICSHPR